MAFTCADLVAYWQLEESNISRADSKGVNNLTQIPGVLLLPSGTGIINNGIAFTGGRSLNRASTTDLTMSGNVSFSLALWMNFPDAIGGHPLMWKGNAVSVLADYEYRVQTNGTKIRFAITDGVSNQAVLDTGPTWSTGTWTFVAAWYDGTNINCSINDGTVTSVAYTAGSWAGGKSFGLGGLGGGGGEAPNGAFMDESSVWKGYAFTAGDITTLYNGGAAYGFNSICPPTPIAWLQTKAMTPALRRHLLTTAQANTSTLLGPGWGRLLAGERNRLVRG